MTQLIKASILIFLISCTGNVSTKDLQDKIGIIESSKSSVFTIADGLDLKEYYRNIEIINKKRIEFHSRIVLLDKESEEDIIREAGVYLDSVLREKIFPYWMGTEWDFNGYTNVPNQGVIACGYFVSTTLKHIGFSLNRYKFAQQASYHEAKTLLFGSEPEMIRPKSKEALKSALEEKNIGLYMVGLDNHVGFLHIGETQIQFIHADYISDKVCVENITDSPAFQSNLYCISPISDNSKLILTWIKGQEIPIITS